MTTGVWFLDALTRGVLLTAGGGLVVEIGLHWFRAAWRHASDEDAG